ncbi:MAG: acyl-CoA transferase [Rhodospirillales bacterium]|nr:acyl-CoA transferase [Rhodospirillales bacterium]
MPSRREQVLLALFGRLKTIAAASVRRKEALPQTVPAGGLVILRDGDPGEPDVTLNPRTEFYSHRAEVEAFVTQPVGGGGETALDALLSGIGTALVSDRSLGGLAENLFWSAPETSMLAIEGAAPVLTARLTVTIEYLVSDPLAA